MKQPLVQALLLHEGLLCRITHGTVCCRAVMLTGTMCPPFISKMKNDGIHCKRTERKSKDAVTVGAQWIEV